MATTGSQVTSATTAVFDPFAGVGDDLLRAGSGLKWHAHPADVLPMWVAEMDARPTSAVVAAVTAALQTGNTGYPMMADFSRSVARFTSDMWGWEVDPARTVAVADVMTGIREVIAVVTEPGDPVIVTPPVYGPFMDVIELGGRVRRDAPLGPDGRLDIECLHRVMDTARDEASGGVVLVLCSPHNPTGVVHTRQELEAVADLAARYGVRVIVDEIHAPLVRPGVDFTPWLKVAGAQSGFSVVSASKGWNLAALKAALVIGGEAAAADIDAVPELVTHGPSHMGMLAQQAAFDDGRAWLDGARASIDRNFDLLASLLQTEVAQVTMAPAEATYLAWLDFRATQLGDDPAQVVLDRTRLALSDGLFFGAGGVGHARMNVATSPHRIEDAVRRIAAAVHAS